MKKGFSFIIGGQQYDTIVKEKEPNIAEVVVNGTSFIVEFKKNESKKVKAARTAAPVSVPVAAPAQPTGTATVKSPLPGSIVKVMVKPGDSIKKGETLLTMESMKMENIVASEYTGTVKNVLVQAGQNVMQDDKLVEIETVAVAAAPAAPKAVAAPQPKPAAAPAPAPAPAPAAAPVGGNKVNSPLPGSVISVAVKEGQAVKKGDTLLVLESMKMENPILADCDGTVSKIAVAPGQSVMQDDLLVVIA